MNYWVLSAGERLARTLTLFSATSHVSSSFTYLISALFVFKTVFKIDFHDWIVSEAGAVFYHNVSA